MLSGTKTGAVVSLLAILTAYLYSRETGEDVLKDHLDTVLSGLLRAERKVGPSREPRVAVGFGGCLDVLADAEEVLKKVGASAHDHPEHFNQINNMEELEKMYAYFFRHGAAAERFMTNQTLFDKLSAIAQSLPNARLNLGGNAPVMAARFQREGCQVLLASSMTESLKKVLPQGLRVTGREEEEDDIHLILEYKRGDVWGHYTAPRANRFIVHSDASNPNLSTLEEFSAELGKFSPSLLVVGGLQMMDNFPFLPGQRVERLGKLRELLTSTPDTTRIHFEMASFAEEECMRDVISNVVYYSDSLGMNEQELPNLHSILSNGSITLISDPYPRIATTLDYMRSVYALLRDTPPGEGRRSLTRLHVHTLAYQAIMTTKGSPWKNTMSAAAKASLTANRHTCGSNHIRTENAKILMDDSFSTSRGEESVRIPFDSDRPVTCWSEEDFDICLAPVLVCTEVVQTAGGGDNISSAGLVLQI